MKIDANTQDKPLPFEPKTLIELREAYSGMEERLYNIGRVRLGMQPPPEFNRKNVFDLETGLRLVLSYEWSPLMPEHRRGPFLHVAGSYHEDLEQKLQYGTTPLHEMMKVVAYITRRSPREHPIHTKLNTDTGVVHMMFNCDIDPAKYDDDSGILLDLNNPESE